MPLSPLSPTDLRLVCDPNDFSFQTTADIEPLTTIIGQPRGVRAIEFGIGIQSQGYNIFVMGETGTGRATAIQHFLQERAQQQEPPHDWVYVNHFQLAHKPRALSFAAGKGTQFASNMQQLIQRLREDLPRAFDTEAYQTTIDVATKEVQAQQAALFDVLRAKAAEQDMAVLNTASGFVIAPVRQGRPLQAAEVQTLSVEERQTLQNHQRTLSAELEEILAQARRLESDVRAQIKQIDREVAATAVQHLFVDLRKQYEGHEDVLAYLDEVHQDVINQIDDFAPPIDKEQEIDLRRYEVNLLVDNSAANGAPVVTETNPTYHNLMGRIEYDMQAGVVTTHFTNIKGGSLHAANGGYLILYAQDVLKNLQAWEALKRALKTREIFVQPAATMERGQILAKSLTPQAIPLSIKIILLGSPQLYYFLYDEDPDFRTLFKVRADFNFAMPRDKSHVEEYAQFIATRCHEESLPHFDRTAVAKVIEFGADMAADQKKLSTRFGQITDLVREASYWAGDNGREIVTAVDVQQALLERRQRANLMEELIKEQILKESVFIATEGRVVGQVNGLTVIDTGEYAFGQPGRITARTFMGNDGIIHIERETDMSGPIHEKGVLTLTGYLGGTYAQHQPLSMSASLTFEQNYSLVDGDSASSTELYALLSSLSRIPIKQEIAVTGSVNQRGEIQPIGGANEKIEGFFHICHARGLTGQQGVLIPASNVHQLMLHEDVVTAVAEGKFHIWAIHTIDEGIELLTDTPAGERDSEGNFSEGTIHYAVQTRLRQFLEEADALKKGSDDSDEDAALE